MNESIQSFIIIWMLFNILEPKDCRMYTFKELQEAINRDKWSCEFYNCGRNKPFLQHDCKQLFNSLRNHLEGKIRVKILKWLLSKIDCDPWRCLVALECQIFNHRMYLFDVFSKNNTNLMRKLHNHNNLINPNNFFIHKFSNSK